MTKYQQIKEHVKTKLLSLVGMEHFVLSSADYPQGAVSVNIDSLEKAEKLAEVLSELDVEHMPSTVSLRSDLPFAMYFREEDLIFALMDKDEKDVEKAEEAFLKKIDNIEKVEKRFVSYNDFIKFYFINWLPE